MVNNANNTNKICGKRDDISVYVHDWNWYTDLIS